jgi:hypothetical protein
MSVLAHPSTVSFGGNFGGVLSFAFTPGTAGIQDVTSHYSQVNQGRIVRDYVCTSIDSGTATVRLLGSSGFDRLDIGTEATLSVTTPAGSLSATAILRSFELEATVGELVRGSAEFTITG